MNLCQYIHVEWLFPVHVYNNRFDILDPSLTYTPKRFELSFCSETLPNILAVNCIQGFVKYFSIFSGIYREKNQINEFQLTLSCQGFS